MNVGIIGYGSMGKMLAQKFLEKRRLTAKKAQEAF